MLAGSPDGAVTPSLATSPPADVVTVLPDVSGIDRRFDYTLGEALRDHVGIGSLVRVPLHGRRVRGWVVGIPTRPPPDIALRAVAAMLAPGPSAEVVSLGEWAAWRWCGRLRPFLLAASPRRLADARIAAPLAPVALPTPGVDELAALVRRGLQGGDHLLRLPPAASRLAVLSEALAVLAGRADLLVLVPETREVELVRRRLGRLGVGVARHPEDWGAAAAGGRVVVGTRTAALAPVGRLGAIVVFDAQAEAYREQRAPIYSAVELARERARRAGVPFLALSACPSLELASELASLELPPALERAKWPAIEVVDLRREDPRRGRYGDRLAPAIHRARAEQPARPVLAVLNRLGRARLLACASCGELARCERCGAAVREEASAGEHRVLACTRCGEQRPLVCARCGAARLKVLRVGAHRAGEEVAALTGLQVAVVAGEGRGEPLPAAPVLVGTEALLHRAGRASLVVFLDFDLDVLAPRLRAAEHALELLARAGRLVGARPEGRVLVQTRVPDHEVLVAAGRGDPRVLVDAEAARRRPLGLPPYAVLAHLSGKGAAVLAEALRREERLVVVPVEGGQLVRAADGAALADALARQKALDHDVRVAVDPLEW